MTAATVYGASPINRHRRTKTDMDALHVAIYSTLEAIQPATVRQLYYQLVSRGVIEKTEAAYKGIVCRLTAEMRRAGIIPYGWLADNTRWMRIPTTYTGLNAALVSMQEHYRRNILTEQGVRIEIWLEKDALAGVVVEETARYHVPLLVTRGYPSLSYLYEAAEAIIASGVPTFIYYFGDHDPSGVDIPRKVKVDLAEMGAEFEFERVAVNEGQIREFNLPTRPTKQTDTRAKNFSGESVELDAIEPDTLRAMVRGCIEQHIDPVLLHRTRLVEAEERATLARIAATFGGAA